MWPMRTVFLQLSAIILSKWCDCFQTNYLCCQTCDVITKIFIIMTILSMRRPLLTPAAVVIRWLLLQRIFIQHCWCEPQCCEPLISCQRFAGGGGEMFLHTSCFVCATLQWLTQWNRMCALSSWVCGRRTKKGDPSCALDRCSAQQVFSHSTHPSFCLRSEHMEQQGTTPQALWIHRTNSVPPKLQGKESTHSVLFCEVHQVHDVKLVWQRAGLCVRWERILWAANLRTRDIKTWRNPLPCSIRC